MRLVEQAGSTVSVVSLTSGFLISDRRFFYVLKKQCMMV